MPKPNHNAVVAKDHSLIGKMSRYKLSELRLIAFCLAHYDSRRSDNPEFKASVDDLREIYPSMDKNSAYGVIRETVKAIGSKPLEFFEDGDLVYWNWFSGFKYRPGEGTFKFYINPHLEPYLLELQGTFTRYRLKDVYQFTSAATWKLYENLKKCWAHSKAWAVELNELKIKLGIPGKYPTWQDLKKRIIEPAIEEINAHSDITVTYEKEKHVRTVTGIVFFVDVKQPEDVITLENPQESVYKALLTCGISNKTALEYMDRIAADKRGTMHFLQLIPAIKKRWDKNPRGVPLPKYVSGAIKSELEQAEIPAELHKTSYADADKTFRSYSDKTLEMLAEAGNLPAKNEIERRKKAS